MNIYKIRLESNRFQHFLPVDEAIWKTKNLRMDCTLKAAHWSPPELWIPDRSLAKSNFCSLTSGGLVIDRESAGLLRSVLEPCGELLPLRHEDDDYYLLNVAPCADALDHDRAELILDPQTGLRIGIQRYVFAADRIPMPSIFKIPEAMATLLVVEGRYQLQEEFKSMVETHSLTGIKFDKLWSDNQ